MKSKDARVCVLNSQHRCPGSLPANASLSGRPLWLHVFHARPQHRHGVFPRARRSKLVSPRATSRASRAFRSRLTTMRPAIVRRATTSIDARAACRNRKQLSRFVAGNASLPGRPPWPHVLLARCQRRRGVLQRARRSTVAARRFTRALCAPRSGLAACKRCGQHYCTAPRRPTMPVPRAQFVNIACFPDSLPATLRCLATRRGPTSFSPVASGVAARATL